MTGTGAWSLTVTEVRQGLVGTVTMAARRKCGRSVTLTAYLFPAGWRMNSDGVPASVRRDALALARRVYP